MIKFTCKNPDCKSICELDEKTVDRISEHIQCPNCKAIQLNPFYSG